MVGIKDNSTMSMKKKKRPQWLDLLLKSKFFGTCNDHSKLMRKNEINIYCVDCGETMCQHCLSSPDSSHHRRSNHQLLQIRRYVYQDVVRVSDMQKLVDCNKVQSFTVNKGRVVLLNPKKICKPSNGKEVPACEICKRSIPEPNRYCSVACKVSEDYEEYQQSESRSSLTVDVYNSNSWSAFSSSDQSGDDNSSCWMKSALMSQRKIQKRKRKGVPRRSSFY